MHRLELVGKERLSRILGEAFDHSEQARFLHRLHCVLLVAQGCSCYQVAEWFGMHPRSVERWVHLVQEHGPEALRDERKTGRPTRLRDDQRKLLQDEVARNPLELGYEGRSWDGKLLQMHLERRYDVALSVRQCQRLLKELRGGARCPGSD